MFAFRSALVSWMLFGLICSSVILVSVSCAEASDNDQLQVISALSDAERSVASAYEAILRANEGGANVSALVVRLNEAEGFCAQAQIAYKTGDFEKAIHLAALCSNASGEVKDEAIEVGLEMSQARLMNLWLSVTISLISVVVIVFGSILGWRVFKKRYYERVLRMEPRVDADGS